MFIYLVLLDKNYALCIIFITPLCAKVAFVGTVGIANVLKRQITIATKLLSNMVYLVVYPRRTLKTPRL